MSEKLIVHWDDYEKEEDKEKIFLHDGLEHDAFEYWEWIRSHEGEIIAEGLEKEVVIQEAKFPF